MAKQKTLERLKIRKSVFESLPLDENSFGTHPWSDEQKCGCLKGNLIASTLKEKERNAVTIVSLYHSEMNPCWNYDTQVGRISARFNRKFPKLGRFIDRKEYELSKIYPPSSRIKHYKKIRKEVLEKLEKLDGEEVKLI